MVCLDAAELASLSAQLLQQLQGTDYQCSSLTLLSGGSANFVYRGTLTTPSPSGGSTVIVKHTTDFLAVNRNFKIDVSRCTIEAGMMFGLEDAPLPFQTPKLLLFDKDDKIQVHQDFGDALNVDAILGSPVTDRVVATAVGCELGFCLKSFHDFVTSDSRLRSRRQDMWTNEPMRQLKYQTSYNSFMGLLDRFPGISDGYKPLLEDVKELATRELAKMPWDAEEDPYWGLIHGDFWAGNVLLLNPPSPSTPNKLVIIDWELSQYGHRAYDLGQFIGDLCEKQLLDNSQIVKPTIEGFLRGYGGITEKLAFRTAIHVGVHFIHWYVRRPPTVEMLETPEKITDALKLGRDFVVKGWTQDRAWFKGTVLAPLFGY